MLLCGFLLPSRVVTRLLHQHQSRERHSCVMRLIAGANGANLDRKVAINAGRELAVPRCARLIQTPASRLRTLRCDCALRPHFPKALPGLTGRQGRGRITIGAKRRVPPVATSSCFAFFGRSLRRAPRFHRGTFVESARFIIKKDVAAWMARKRWAEPGDLNRCSFRSRRRIG